MASLLLVFFTSVGLARGNQEVLVLHSYNEAYPWTRDVSDGIRQSLADSDAVLSFEYMDLLRYDSGEYLDRLANLYRFKYGGSSPAVVVTVDDGALEFVAAHRGDLFVDIPIVFCGVNAFESFDLSRLGDVTGVVEQPDLAANVQLLLELHPTVNKVKLFFESATSASFAAALRQAYPDRIPVESFSNPRLAEFVNQIRLSDRRTLVLVLDEPPGWPPDEGATWDSIQDSSAPIYFLWRNQADAVRLLDAGALGVTAINGLDHGLTAGGMVREILAGTSAASIPLARFSPYTLYLDYHRMFDFGLSGDLPSEVIVLNRPGSLAGEQAVWMWGIGLVALFQSGLIVALLMSLRQRKRASRERQRLEEQLRQAQKMEAVGQLAGGIAHDFNNLLQAILGFTDVALTRLDPGSRVCQDLEEVKRAGERAAVLTRQLLAFSRRQLLQPSEIDVNQLIRDFSLMLRRLIGEHIEFVFVPAQEPVRIRADRAMVEQVLLNLAVNARDAMPEGGKLQIRTRRISLNQAYCDSNPWAKPGRYVELQVRDTGCGMPPDVVERIFEPFFTTKTEGKGSGLGLAMVYGIIKQHEGLIHVTSHEGSGTEFRVFFPWIEGETPLPHPQTRKTVESEPRPASGTILVAEDEDLVRELAERVLSDAGYSVVTARDGEEAVQVIDEKGRTIDLCLLDVVMPGLGGLQVVQHIRRVNPEIRILLSSGYSDALGEDRTLQLIEKPYTPQILLQKVAELLEEE